MMQLSPFLDAELNVGAENGAMHDIYGELETKCWLSIARSRQQAGGFSGRCAELVSGVPNSTA